jgi:ATP-dependent DNA ligase
MLTVRRCAVSRNRNDLTPQFPEIAHALQKLRGGDVVIDGEIVVFDRHEVSRFQLLLRRSNGGPVRPVYAVFDCLEAAGRSLLDRPVHERREALERIAPERSEFVMLARRVRGGGRRAHELASEGAGKASSQRTTTRPTSQADDREAG